MINIDFYLSSLCMENVTVKDNIELSKQNISTMFSKNECIALTGLTTRQIDSLRTHNIVKGQCFNGNKCEFSWSELVEMKAIAKLREKVSLQKIREAKNSLKNIDFNDNFLSNKRLVCLSKEIILIDEKEDILLTITGMYKGQTLLTVLFCDDILKELRTDCENKIIDFEKRLEKNNLPNIRRLIKAS